MIQKFENPELLTQEEIDLRYDGKYVAILQDDQLFSRGLGYVVAVCEKTDENVSALWNYNEPIHKPIAGMGICVHAAKQNSWEDELYVVIRNFQRKDFE